MKTPLPFITLNRIHIQDKEWLVGNLSRFLFLILGISKFSHELFKLY